MYLPPQKLNDFNLCLILQLFQYIDIKALGFFFVIVNIMNIIAYI